jgi:hypothetical protein
MFRRWSIRTFALLLVVAVSAMWVRSYYVSTFVTRTANGIAIHLQSARGAVYLLKARDLPSVAEWHFGDGDFEKVNDPTSWEAVSGSYFPHLLGIHHLFGFTFGRVTTARFLEFAIPYWFIDSACILIGLYVWRKTRPKPNPVMAFPVVVEANGTP